MKVLYLTNLPAPYKVECFNLLGQKCELTVVFERENASNRNSLWRSDEKRNYEEHFLKGMKVGEEDSFSFEIIRFLKQHFDIIVIGGYSTPTTVLALLYCKLKKINYVLAVDGMGIEKDSIIKHRIKNFLISNAGGYLSPGHKSSEALMFYGAKNNRIFIYPFTSLQERDINEKILTKEQKKHIKEKLGIAEEDVVVAVGQYIPRKGFDVLLKAATEFPKKVGIYIIGGAVPISEYTSIIKSNNLEHIHFVEFKKKDDLLEYYSCADIFVLPTREDIWGLVINEAMAKGLPIITTDQCGAGLELVHNGVNGWIVPVDSHNDISKYVNKLLNDSSLCDAMGAESLNIINEYTLEKMAECFYEAFCQISTKSEKNQIIVS